MVMPLPGCSTQSQRLGADDGSDVCRPQRVALDSTGDYFGEDIVKGAALGAIGGGLIGALATGNARGALIGAAAGGVAGAAGGYWAARQKQAADQATLYQNVYSDIERDNITIDKTQAAFNQLVDCRQAEAARIRYDLRAGTISRPQAEAAMAAVRARSAFDLNMATTISNHIQTRSADFAFANAQVNPGASTSPTPPPRPARATSRAPARVPPPPTTPAGQVQAATSTNLAKRDQFNQSIARAQSNTSAFELS
jgi:hypothetical protein